MARSKWLPGRRPCENSKRPPIEQAEQLASSSALASNASRNHGDSEISEVSSTSANQFAGKDEFASLSKAE
jgi:hypothetical protein